MIPILFSLLLLSPDGYLASYPSQSSLAMQACEDCCVWLKKLLPDATEDECMLIFSIVAPEVSQYDSFRDFLEVKALQMKYVKDGSCDYSVGYFQMKPSFAEGIEKEISRNAALRGKYGKMFAYASTSEREQRRERVSRLCSVDWQVRYLAVFVEVVQRRTASWGLADDEEKLRCWATLYNAGTYLSKDRVMQRQGVKQFPRGTREFNYSSISLEFYRKFRNRQ